MTSFGNDVDINIWPKQGLALASDATEILYGGAAGGGKSYLLRIAACVWCCDIPGLQVYIFRRELVDLKKNHVEGPKGLPNLLAPLVNAGYVSWNKGNNEFSFWNGSKIFLCHCQRPSDVYGYQGAEIHVLLIDELSQFEPSMYKYLRSRVRMIGINVPERWKGKFPRVLCGSNPGGICHSYMKMSWIQTAKPMEIHRAPPDEGGLLRQFIPARISDNPSLLSEDPTYVDRLRGLGDEALVKAYLEGSFDIVTGGMFTDVWNADVHILKPFKIPYSWYIDRSFDMGTAVPFCVSWFAQSDGTEAKDSDGEPIYFPSGTIIQIGEWYGWNGKPDEGCRLPPNKIAEGIKRIEAQAKLKVNPGPADNMIFSNDAYGNNISKTMASYDIDWDRSDKSPGSRINGWSLIRQRLFNAIDNNGDPGLYFFRNCVHTIRTLPEAPRDQTRVEDINQNFEDHCLEALRQRIMTEEQTIQHSNRRTF